jgi:DNA-binding MarR family transcriptional regulator
MNEYPGYLLRRASVAAMARLAKRLKALQLSPTEAAVLTVIDANPNGRQSDIGRLLDIASANMAPLISRLAKRDLIDRQPVDGRSHGLSLSRTGRTLVARVKSIMAEHEERLIGRIPAPRRRAFLAALRALQDEPRPVQRHSKLAALCESAPPMKRAT